MPSVINELIVAELAEKFRDVENALVVDYTGLSGPQSVALRDHLRQHGGRMMVVKNSLARIALERAQKEGLGRLLVGPCALVTGDDPVVLTKAIVEWGKKELALKWRGAYVGGEVLGPEQTEALASLPPLDVLRAQAVGTIAAPLSGFVGVLQAVLRSFVGVVKAIAEKGESGG